MTQRIQGRWLFWMLVAVLFAPAPVMAKRKPRRDGPPGHRISTEKNGSVATRTGLRLRLMTDLGNVRIRTKDAGQVEYRVRLEADADDPNAKQLLDQFTVSAHGGSDGVTLRGQIPGSDLNGQIWVTWEITVPTDYGVEASTQAGNLDVGDVHGRLVLSTEGGNISAGNVAGSARLDTKGGHITVGDVSSELTAETAGGHVTAGQIGGRAVLHTGGGHIHVTSVREVARLETDGGNISVEHSGGELIVETGGGQITVGEAAGAIHARTGGGGIRVAKVAGATELETGSGGIYLTQVGNAVRASTGAGRITAWFGPDLKLEKPCELESGQGDIDVYLPRQFPVTIDATIRLGDEHRFISDPAFPLKVVYENSGGGVRTVRAEGPLNGGGPVLRLRTVAGNIRLILCDATQLLQQRQLQKQQMESLQQQLRVLQQKNKEMEKDQKEDDQK
jgi:hypothetical protein